MNSYCIFAICSLALLTSCGTRSPETRTEEPSHAMAMDSPLDRFDQELTTPQKQLVLKPGQTVVIPVTVRNLTGLSLISTGRYPITLSYRWFENGKMLPIEGNRSVLPRPVKPNEQETVNAKVTSPQSGTDLTLRFSLVQEGIAWFFSKGGQTLDIPTRVEP